MLSDKSFILPYGRECKHKMAGEDKRKDKGEDNVKEDIKKLKDHIAGKQQDIRAKGLPIIVLVEGWAAAGKGGMINVASQAQLTLAGGKNGGIEQNTGNNP